MTRAFLCIKLFPWFSFVLSRKPVVYCALSRVCFPLLTSSGLFLFSAFLHLLRVLLFTLRPLAMVMHSPSFQLTYVHNWFLLSLYTSEKKLLFKHDHPPRSETLLIYFSFRPLATYIIKCCLVQWSSLPERISVRCSLFTALPLGDWDKISIQ